jgi:signal transduction histidine kinase
MNSELEEYSLYLISNLTHQAINPLNGVIGTLDNLLKGTVPENKRAQRINSARSQLEYTVLLIRNLAFFAQYGSEKSKVEPIKKTKENICVIPQVLIEAAQFFQEQARDDEIKIEVHDRHIQNAVYGDPSLLRQVFINILDNAVKYGEKHSVININTGYRKKQAI